MDDYTITHFHHEGAFFKNRDTLYVGKKEPVAVFDIDKDHFSMIEMLYYTKELGKFRKYHLEVDEGFSEANERVYADVDIVEIEQYVDEDLDGVETYVESTCDSEEDDIKRNKATRYIGRLGIDEDYIDSLEADSDNSKDESDPEAVAGVDLPARRKSTKLRYDNKYGVSILELRMIFESVVEFREALTKYAIEYKVKLKLRPNEKKRVKTLCKDKRSKWLLYDVLDRESGDFMGLVMRVSNNNGLDGCFLKDAYEGELLVAVDRNGNRQMFSIAG
ncbi:hypothetical protein HAX54_007307 [Datura stramonium]|uniref:Transposase MuDR plant domain-containing protein n=1 Tax=Datura stramonium TaxID=4076 RepID=A0ABS8TCY4_DATST|nr:hypothetical protein [Datura stramonium]